MRLMTAGQQIEPCYYMVKYSHTGLEQGGTVRTVCTAFRNAKSSATTSTTTRIHSVGNHPTQMKIPWVVGYKLLGIENRE